VIIQVSAFNIAGDGVPGDGDLLDPDYAVVVYNAQTVTGPLAAFAGQTTTELPGAANSDGDSFFEPCETLQSAITVTNVGTATATGVNVTITSTTPGVTIVNGSASLGSLAPGASATGNVTFKLLPTFVPGTTVTINVSVTFGPGSGSTTASYTVPTSCPLAPGGTFTFSNPAPITIPALGTATPYPSTINVSGIPAGHVITKVTVTITNFNHTWPSDVGVALRGPGGQICVLFNNAIGGSGGVTNRTYTFDQTAPPLPTSGFPPSGTYGPNNNGGTRTFTGLGSPPYNSNLNIFNGLSGASVNGTWELFVQDFAGGDDGNINGGWSITIQTGTPNCSTTAP
jgi:subtilisin-like proprotein convertase family protein